MLERFKVPKKDRVYVEEQKVRLVTEKVFVHLGLSQDAAKINADVLITNDLRGVEWVGGASRRWNTTTFNVILLI